MPKHNPTIDERLIQCKISRERYDSEATRLINLGFSQQETDSLIIRSSSSNTVRAVLNNCRLLLITPYQLSHEQIVSIAGHDGGSKNIYAVKTYFQELLASEYSIESITAMASQNGCSGAIRNAVGQEFRKFLEALGAVLPANTVTPLTNMGVFSLRGKVTYSESLHNDENESNSRANKRMRTEKYPP